MGEEGENKLLISKGKKRNLGQSAGDIAEIVSLSSPGETGTTKLKADIHRYISKLRTPCPTPECNHGLTEAASVCKGYETQAHIINSQSLVPETCTTKSNPLVIPVFCYVFSELNQDDREKEVCKKCREESFSYKEKFDGLFCHGCGFFVDYEHRKVGYSDEWTTATSGSGLTIRLDIRCSYCGRGGVSAKFGDYWFCTPYCMQKWYISGGGTAKKEERGGEISFLG